MFMVPASERWHGFVGRRYDLRIWLRFICSGPTQGDGLWKKCCFKLNTVCSSDTSVTLPNARSPLFRLAACLIAGLFCVGLELHAQGRAECSVIDSRILGHPVRYCAFLPASFDADKTRRYPVVYYLHGLGDNEQSLLNTGGWDLVSELRSQGKIGDFVILAPSGGRTFFINSENGKVRYEDFFMKEFMPQMEKKYRAEGTRATRGITGISMGGYGALHYAFKYPTEFAAVSAEMPALIADLPKNVSSAPGSAAS